MSRAFVVSVKGRDTGGSLYHAKTAGKARYEALLDFGDCLPDLTFADLSVRRAPEMDRATGLDGAGVEDAAEVVRERDAVAAWNEAYPCGAPVVVRLDGGGEQRTRTRSAASMLCGRAVVWCDGIAGCYALSHVTPLPASADSLSPSVQMGGEG